jgi:peptidyl-prolyl cis-trans isomerase A (cyclophilin A)
MKASIAKEPSHVTVCNPPQRSLPFWRATVLATCTFLAAVSPAMAQKVRLATTAGDIVFELDKAKAPKTVENFVQYVKAGHYNGTIFHRVIDNFMIQGGGMTADMAEKPTRAPIPLESRNGLSNVRGTLAMARTAVPDSATAQFFINLKDNLFLDQAMSRDGEGYAVFGKVVAGMDVVEKIRLVTTGNKGPHQNVPLEPILIKKASIED